MTRTNAKLKSLALLQPVLLRYLTTNVLLIALVVALAAESWTSWLVLAATLLVGGPLDELSDDLLESAGDDARLFCQANLYMTLPLLLLVTGLYFRIIANHVYPGLGEFPPFIDHYMDAVVLVGVGVATGYFYALAGATVAHELIHRRNSLALISARVLLALTLNASFERFHLLSHHPNVATAKDASTAWRGEYILVFVVRSVVLQWRSGYALELKRLQTKGQPPLSLHNHMLVCVLCSITIGIVAFLIASWPGVVGFLSAAILGRFLHESVNYVQHYGLVRVEGSPIEARHAWDTYRPNTSFMQYNLSRHSHHHLNGTKPFWDLQPMANAAHLPHGYMTMVLLAFVPAIWRRTMDPLLSDWDRRLASEGERALLRQQYPATSES